MKRICLSLLVLLLVCGCSAKKSGINISKWMFDKSLNAAVIEKKLGTPSEGTDNFQIIYDDYDLYNGISGRLRYGLDSENWSFSAQVPEKQYDAIYESLKSTYTEMDEKDISDLDSYLGVYKQFMMTSGPDDKYLYAISLQYIADQATMILNWGGIVVLKPEFRK